MVVYPRNPQKSWDDDISDMPTKKKTSAESLVEIFDLKIELKIFQNPHGPWDGNLYLHFPLECNHFPPYVGK